MPLLLFRSLIRPLAIAVRKAIAVATLAFFSFQSVVYALPQGFNVVEGDVTFSQPDINTLNITSNSMQAIVHYQAFDVGTGQTVNFFLPNTQAMILNQILGSSGSQILGNINSNGQIFLVNTNGINIGASAQINVGALVASTLHIQDQDFLTHQFIFRQLPDKPGAVVENSGNIEVLPGGYVVLNGAAIVNKGNINVPQGSTHLAVGDKISMTMEDGVKVNVTVDEALKKKVTDYQEAIANQGTLKAASGLIKLQAKLTDSLYEKAINNTGKVKAESAVLNQKGQIEFIATQSSTPALVQNSGEINTSGTTASPNGGSILVSGGHVKQAGKVLSESSSHGMGGNVTITSSHQTDLEANSLTSVRGNGDSGNGGNLLIWSDKNTYFKPSGLIDVRGGDISGDGGFVEISAKDSVYLGGLSLGDAVRGRAGSILIDPIDIIIQGGGTDPGSGSVLYTANPGTTQTYDPNFFSGFATVNLQATNDISILDPFNLPSTTSFTLSANNDINIQNTLTVGTNLTASNISLTADAANGASANGVGNINITGAGSIVKLGSGTLTLQGNDLNLNGLLDLGSGAVTLRGTNDINLNSTINTTGNAAISLIADYNNTGVPSNGIGNINFNNTAIINKSGTGGLTFQGTNITLDGTFSNLGSGAVSASASNNVTLNSDLASSGAITLSADANLTGAVSNATGDVVVNGNINKSGSSTLTLQGTNVTQNGTIAAGTGAVTMNASNNVYVNNSITSTSGANPNWSFTGDANLTNAPINGVGGVYTNTSGSMSKSGNGTITFTGATIDIDASVNSGSGSVSFQPSQAARPIEVGGGSSVSDAEPGTALSISNPELNLLNSADLNTIIGATSNTGGLTVVGPVSLARQLTLINPSSIITNAGGTINISNRQLVFTSDNIDINATVNAGSGNVFLRSPTAAKNTLFMGSDLLSDPEPGTALSISAAEVGLISTSGTLTVGQASNTGTLTILGAFNKSSNLTLNSSTVLQNVGSTLTLAGNKSLVISGDTIDLNDSISVGSGNITLAPISTTRNVQIGGSALLTDPESGTSLLISNAELGLLTSTGTITLGGTANTSGSLTLLNGLTPTQHISLVSGNSLTIGAGNTINTSAGNKNITLTAQTIDINDTLNAGTGTITLQAATTARNVEVGGGTNISDAEPGTAMRISNPELALLTAGTINIGNTQNGAGTFTVIGNTSLTNSHLGLYARNLITVSNPISLGNNKNLTLQANDLAISNTINNGTGTLNLYAVDGTRPYNIGGTAAVAGTFRLTSDEFPYLTAGNINIGTSSYTRSITISGDFNVNSNLTLINDGTAGSYTSIIQNAGTTITTNNKNLTLQGNTIDLNGTINAGTGNVTISPTTNARPVTVADATAGGTSEVSFTDLNISTQELGTISAGTLTIGTTSNTGGLTVGGDYDISSRYNLSLINAGGITAVDRYFNTGSKNLNLNAISSNLSWTTTGNNRPISLGTVTANGNATISTTGSNSGITASSLSTTGGLTTSTAGTSSPINISSLTSFGTGNVNVTLDSLQSDLTVGGNFIHNGTGASTVRLNAGFSTDGNTLNNANAILSLGSGSTVASSATKNWRMYTGGGSVFNNNSLFNRTFTFSNLDFRTGGANTHLDFSLTSKAAATSFTVPNLTMQAQGSGSLIKIGGTITNTGNLDILGAGNVAVTGALNNTGLSGTSVRLGAGYLPDGTLADANSILSLGTTNISNDSNKTLSVWTGAGTPFSNSYFNNLQTFNTLDLRAGGAVDIASSSTPMTTSVSNLVVQSGGNAYITNSGTSLTLGKSGSANQTSVAGILGINNNQAITTDNTITAGTLNLTTTANNGNITLAHDSTISSAANFTTNGTGILTLTTGSDVNVSNGPISVLARNLDMQGTSTLNAGTGTLSLTPNANGLSFRFGDAGAGTGNFDINASEMNRLFAGTISLGTNTLTGNLTQAGNIDISNRYNLSLAHQDSITTTGYSITGSNESITFNTPGTINLGGISGTSTTLGIHAGTGLTVGSAITLAGTSTSIFDTSNNGNIQINANISGGTSTSLSTNGIGNITLATGTSISNTNGSISLIANNIALQGTSTLNSGASGSVALRANGNKDIKILDNADGDGDDATFDINTSEMGLITTGSLQISNTADTGGITVMGDLDLTGKYNLTLANGGNVTGSNVSLLKGNKSLFLNTLNDINLSDTGNNGGYAITGITANNVSLTTDGNNSSIQLSNAYSGSNVTLRTLSSNSNITTNDITTTGSLDILTKLSSISTGSMSNTGGAGTSVRLAAGFDTNGTLSNASSTMTLPTINSLSISNNASKDVKLWDGVGNIFSQNFITSTPTLNLLDLRTASAINFGSSGTPLQTAIQQLMIQTTGSAYINNSGNLTLGISGDPTSFTATSGVSLTNNGNLLVLNTMSGNTISLQTTGSNGSITVEGGDLQASGAINLATHGTGILTVNNGKQIATNNNTINIVTKDIDIDSGSISAGTSGSMIIKTTAVGADMEIGDGLAGNINALKLSNTELANLQSGDLTFGSNTSTGNITFGNANLSTTGHLTLNTSGNILDGTATDALANIILASNKNLTITGNSGLGSGQVGTSGIGDLDVTLAGTGFLLATTNNQQFNLKTTNALSIQSLITGSGNIQLSAGTTISDLDNIGDNILTTGTLSLTSSGAIGGLATPLNINTGALTASSSSGGVFLNHSGNLVIDSLSAGSGNIALTSAGNISDLDNIGDNILTTGTLSLTSSGAIGGLATPLNINTGALTASSSSGGVFLNHSGNLVINTLQANSGNISLNAASILDNDTVDDSMANISSTGTIELIASTGDIGSNSNKLDVNAALTANALKASATSGSIFIRETSGALTPDNITANTTTGTVWLSADEIHLNNKTITGHDITLLTDQIDLNGSIWATGGNVFLLPSSTSSGIGLDSASGSFNLTNSELANIHTNTLEIGSTQTQGDVYVGGISLNSNLTLRSSGNVYDMSAADDSVANITLTNNHNLSFLGGTVGMGQIGDKINFLDDIDVTLGGAGTLNVVTNNKGAYINLRQGGYLGTMNVGSAGFILSAGDQQAGTSGSLLDGNGDTLNITAGSDSSMTAGFNGTSTIGTNSDAFEILMTSGTLTTTTTGASTGVSINLTGTLASPLIVTTAPPGGIVTQGIQVVLPSVEQAPIIAPPYLLNTQQNPTTSTSSIFSNTSPQLVFEKLVKSTFKNTPMIINEVKKINVLEKQTILNDEKKYKILFAPSI